MKQLLYIHGLGSGRDSRKYRLIQESFHTTHNCACAEWNEDSDIRLFLFNLYKRYLDSQELVLIGDSTGGNYAHQLRDILVKNGLKVILILINPLLNLEDRIGSFPFPDSLQDSLATIEQVDHCFLLQSLYDEVIDQNQVKIGRHVVQLKVDDSHCLFTLAEHMPVLKYYVQGKQVFSSSFALNVGQIN